MNRIVSIDGEIVPAERAVVSVLDRGFLYGDGVFESLRVYQGRAFALEAHLARLGRACAELRIALPAPLGVIAGELERAVASSGLEDAYARVTITRGVGARTSLVPTAPSTPLRVILVEPLTLPPRAIYANGLRAATIAWGRVADGAPVAAAKLLSYVTSMAALEEARGRGADEALFVGADARVCEGSTSNVFLVAENGRLVTPPTGAGVFDGITRSHVLEIARALGHAVSIETIAANQLPRAREVFLTSSLRELASVVSVDGETIGAGEPGPIARAIHRAYRVRVGADGPLPWE